MKKLSKKYRVFWGSMTLSLLLLSSGYLSQFVYVFIVGLVLFLFALSVIIYADKKSIRYFDIVLDGIFFGLF